MPSVRHVASLSRLDIPNVSEPLTNNNKISETITKCEGVMAPAKNARTPHEMGTSRISARCGAAEMMRPSEPPHRRGPFALHNVGLKRNPAFTTMQAGSEKRGVGLRNGGHHHAEMEK